MYSFQTKWKGNIWGAVVYFDNPLVWRYLNKNEKGIQVNNSPHMYTRWLYLISFLNMVTVSWIKGWFILLTTVGSV